ncbi:hypothetical protein F6V30_13045 [Oryzomonas sagensis]|uniref:Potassium channel domain-containing protein n=1 Tax=Oryzomonas sagensis TaxID=2603857 RepID=A0ABQ6TMW8_9BACT|nr:hypothetical protein [Oryzomonas sagensis]KAB0669718.1 hypothetical protein F6V30_13045 [Oryzomonas sagensis]
MKRLRLEQRTSQLLPRGDFLVRLGWYWLFGCLFLAFSLGIGTVGYHISAHLNWVDAFLNASMILTGMGPVDKLESAGAKLFASFYAIFSGVSFLTFCGVLFTPIYHRFIHRFHLDLGDKNL